MRRIRIAASCRRSAGSAATGRRPRARDGATTVRIDGGVAEGSEISIYFDPLIAKLVTHGPDRIAAIDAMQAALDRYLIDGIAHNLPFLAALMAHPRWREGAAVDRLHRRGISGRLCRGRPGRRGPRPAGDRRAGDRTRPARPDGDHARPPERGGGFPTARLGGAGRERTGRADRQRVRAPFPDALRRCPSAGPPNRWRWRPTGDRAIRSGSARSARRNSSSRCAGRRARFACHGAASTSWRGR